jgi:UDP-xylose/UDP-N-acetylglucosamine transporter B4
VLTTLSASQPTSKVTAAGKENSSTFTYGIGICILSLALFLSGVLGLAQDLMYSKYGRPGSSTSQRAKLSNKNKNETTNRKSKHPPTSKSDSSPDWQESMFYLHFLSLPMFWFVRQDLATQFLALSAAPKMYLTLPPLPILPLTLHAYLPASLTNSTTIAYSSPLSPTIAIPAPFLPLLLNTLTQLLCVAGVHRLTTSVSSLSVTLVLVVRKAVSLVISVMWLHRGTGEDERNGMLWFGAGMVLVGTVGYSIGSRAGLGKAGKVRSGKTRKVKIKPE